MRAASRGALTCKKRARHVTVAVVTAIDAAAAIAAAVHNASLRPLVSKLASSIT